MTYVLMAIIISTILVAMGFAVLTWAQRIEDNAIKEEHLRLQQRMRLFYPNDIEFRSALYVCLRREYDG